MMNKLSKIAVFALSAALVFGAMIPTVAAALPTDTPAKENNAATVVPLKGASETGAKGADLNESAYDLYGENGTFMTVSDGTLLSSPSGEQKAMVKGFSSNVFDVKFTVGPTEENGEINGGLYVLAKDPDHPCDRIDALDVNIDKAEGKDYYQAFIYRFNGTYVGADAKAVKLRYNGGDIAVRVISDGEFIHVYLENSSVPSISKRISATNATGSMLGFRALNVSNRFTDIEISDEPEIPEAPTVKVLMIGNSYAQDTMTHTHELARAEGINLVCGVLYYGGCKISQHAEFVKNRSKVYTYFKNGTTDRTNTDFFDVLYDEDWDYITFQTGGGLGGIEESWYPYLHELVALVERLLPRVEIGLFMSWGAPYYREGKGDYKLAMYNDSSDEMYAATVNCFKNLQKNNGIKFLVPAAETMYRAHGTIVCDNTTLATSIHRDDTAHANEKGRYLLALTMFRAITGRRATGCKYDPVGRTYGNDPGPSEGERRVLQGVCDNVFDNCGYTSLDLFKIEVVPPTLEGIRVEGAKIEYREGQPFNYKTAKVYAVYSDGSEEIVEYFRIDKMRALTVEDTEITVCYLDKSVTIPITVTEKD